MQESVLLEVKLHPCNVGSAQWIWNELIRHITDKQVLLKELACVGKSCKLLHSTRIFCSSIQNPITVVFHIIYSQYLLVVVTGRKMLQ